MPWSPADSRRHKKGLSPKQQRQWAHVANSMLSRCLARGGSQSTCEGRAVRAANSAVGKPARPTSNTSLLTVNTALTVEPQRLRRHDQDYLVAPCVMLVAGVLNQGLVVNEAIVPQDWDHVPVVINHPQDATGQAVSARSPEVLTECGIGQVFHARLGQGLRRGHAVASLIGELWINLADAQRCGELAQQAVQMLEAQTPLECSTAFFPEVLQTPGIFHGTPYTEVYTRLRPDHLALLPGAIGACSWSQGCGAPRLNHDDSVHTCGCLDADCVCQQGVMPMEDSPTRTRWQRFWQFVQEFMPEGDDEHEAEEATPATPVNYRALEVEAARERQMHGLDLTPHEQFILGAPDTYAAQTGPTLRLNETDVDIRANLYGQLALEMGVDSTPIFILDIDMVAQTFRYRLGERLCQRSWTIDDGVLELSDEHTDVQRTTTYTPIPHSPAGPHDAPAPSQPETYQEESDPMPPTPTVKARVDALITNERTIWTELDRPDLEQLSESVLIRMANQPLPDLPRPPTGPRPLTDVLADLNPEERDALEDAIVTQQEEKEGLLLTILANKLNPFTREELQVMKVKRLKQLVDYGGDVRPGQPASAPLNFHGRRLPHLRIVTQDGEDDPRPPALPNTMELVVEEQKRRGVRF
jgi:hypothetical protein